MNCVSTSDNTHIVSMRDAVLKGQPPGEGLYVPVSLPRLSNNFLKHISEYELCDIAFEVLYPFFSDLISKAVFEALCESSFDFPMPVSRLSDTFRIQELFHGPSMAFKDVGARFLARLHPMLGIDPDKTKLIVVATSGDTGAAVASGYKGVPDTQVLILYPYGKISPIQEQMMLNSGDNVRPVGLDGTFDDCQRLIKCMLRDEDLRNAFVLTTANSINVGRLLPQIVYYFDAIRQWPVKEPPRYVCVPSGNLGNLTAGVMAKRIGLPVRGFIAATNSNNTFSRFLQKGVYQKEPVVSTLANAMDVGSPSNFERLYWLYGSTWNNMNEEIIGYTVHDDQIRYGIVDAYSKYKYVLDPHTAVGLVASLEFQQKKPGQEVLLIGTASPAKFPEVVGSCLGKNALQQTLPAQAKSPVTNAMEPSFSRLKSWVMHEFT